MINCPQNKYQETNTRNHKAMAQQHKEREREREKKKRGAGRRTHTHTHNTVKQATKHKKAKQNTFPRTSKGKHWLVLLALVLDCALCHDRERR